MPTYPNELAQPTVNGGGSTTHGGLTKREHMALELMKAQIIKDGFGCGSRSLATSAVNNADALISQLNGR